MNFNAASNLWQIDENWYGTWNPPRDEYGYPVNSSMPEGLYADHQGFTAMHWDPRAGQWDSTISLEGPPDPALVGKIRRRPPELPFEALDHEAKKAIRRDRAKGKIRPARAPLSAAADPTGDARRKREQSASRRIRVGMVAAVAAGGLLIAGVTSLIVNPPDSGNVFDAQTACENAIKAQLKAPSTAKFSNTQYVDKDPAYTVRLDVDAENSFGATIRDTFTCEIRRSGSDYRVSSVS